MKNLLVKAVTYRPLILGTDCMDSWHCKSINGRGTVFL